MGIKVRKRWVATKDERTRASHADLDGEIVDYDKPFSNDLMYPGDPSGPAVEVYNCRCTTAYAEKPGIEGEPRMVRVRNPVTGKNVVVPQMNYREWEQWKKSSLELKNSAGERIVKVKTTTVRSEPNSITQKQKLQRRNRQELLWL